MRVAFDTVLMRPGCVLLQAAMGGSVEFAKACPTDSWLLHPTPDLKVYPLEDWQIPVLIEKVKRAGSVADSSSSS